MDGLTSPKKEDIKVYLKVQALAQEPSDSYIEINNDHINFKTANLRNNTINVIKYEMDKIFKKDDEYSYLYEDITLNCISEALSGRNICFISLGTNDGEKHSILFGGRNCHENITERGLMPRIIDAFPSKPNITLSYSIMCVNNNNLIDLTQFITKPSSIPSLTEASILSKGITIECSPKIIEKINKIPINSEDEFIATLKHYNLLFSHLYEMEDKSTSKLFSFSHFIYVVYVYDNLHEKMLSTITFCELCGNDLLNTQVTNPGIAGKNTQINTNAVINNTNTIESLKTAIKIMKTRKGRQQQQTSPAKTQVALLESAKLLVVLHPLCFSNSFTKFKMIGCIKPNVGMQACVKDTLTFLFDCKRLMKERISKDFSLLTANDDNNKIEIINELQNENKDLSLTIKELHDMLEFKNKQVDEYHALYLKQIDKLKQSFGFKGDVNVLLGGGDNSKEARRAKKISESVMNLKYEKMQNEQLTKKIEEQKGKIAKLTKEIEIMKTDEAMIYYMQHAKETKDSEMERLKIQLSHSTELNKLKEENTKLIALINKYKKEIDANNKVVHGFSAVITKAQQNGKDKDDIRNEIRLEYEEKTKTDNIDNNMKHSKEIELLTKKYESLLQQKTMSLTQVTKSYDDLLSQTKSDIQCHLKEMLHLYEIITKMMQSFKKEFNWKVPDQFSVTKYHQMMLNKDNYMKYIDTTETYINLVNFPITVKAFETRKAAFLQKGERNDSNIDTLFKLPKASTNKSSDELDEAKKEINHLKEKLNHMLDMEQARKDKCKCDDLGKIKYEEVQYKTNKKLEKAVHDLVDENSRYKISVASLERTVSKLTLEINSMKTTLGRKTVTDSVNFPLPSTISKTRNTDTNYLLYRNKSVSNITSTRMSRPQTGYIYPHTLQRNASCKGIV